MLPRVIKIGGLEILVEESTSLASNRDRFGEYSFIEQKITIDKSIPHGKKMETLIHEILEAINVYLELGLPHDKLTVLGFMLYQVLKDNEIEFSRTP